MLQHLLAQKKEGNIRKEKDNLEDWRIVGAIERKALNGGKG